MKGRRLPVDPEYNARYDGTIPFMGIERPGDYCGPVKGWTGDKPAVFFLKPNALDPDAPPIAREILTKGEWHK